MHNPVAQHGCAPSLVVAASSGSSRPPSSASSAASPPSPTACSTARFAPIPAVPPAAVAATPAGTSAAAVACGAETKGSAKEARRRLTLAAASSPAEVPQLVVAGCKAGCFCLARPNIEAIALPGRSKGSV